MHDVTGNQSHCMSTAVANDMLFPKSTLLFAPGESKNWTDGDGNKKAFHMSGITLERE